MFYEVIKLWLDFCAPPLLATFCKDQDQLKDNYCQSKSSAVHHLQGAESNRVVLQHHLALLKVPRSHQHPALTLRKRLGMFILQSNCRELHMYLELCIENYI